MTLPRHLCAKAVTVVFCVVAVVIAIALALLAAQWIAGWSLHLQAWLMGGGR